LSLALLAVTDTLAREIESIQASLASDCAPAGIRGMRKLALDR